MIRVLVLDNTVSFRRLQEALFLIFEIFLLLLIFLKPTGLSTGGCTTFSEDFGEQPIRSVWMQCLQGGEREWVRCKAQHLVVMPGAMWPENAQEKGTSHPSLSCLMCAEQHGAPAHPPAVFLPGLCPPFAPDQTVWLHATAYI